MTFLRNIFLFVFINMICINNVFATTGGGVNRLLLAVFVFLFGLFGGMDAKDSKVLSLESVGNVGLDSKDSKILILADNKTSQSIESNLQDSNLSLTRRPTNNKILILADNQTQSVESNIDSNIESLANVENVLDSKDSKNIESKMAFVDKKDFIESSLLDSNKFIESSLTPTHRLTNKKDSIESKNLNAAHRPFSDKILTLADNQTQSIKSKKVDSKVLVLADNESIESNSLSPIHRPTSKGDSIESNSLNVVRHPFNDKILILADNQSIESNSQDSNTTQTTATSTKDSNNNDIESYKLNAIVATTNSIIGTYQGSNNLKSQLLDSNPSGNGDITSILRILPNVQYDTQQNKSTTPGEIDTANISISGGLYYQNNFQLDGFNMNNDLDPAGSQASNPVAANAMPGRSQGLNVDTSILESINVQDSNISAAYGGFTGGVVEANTKKATKKFGANVSYQITQGDATLDKASMTNYHLYNASDSDYANFLNSSSASNQPKFIKHLFKSSFESRFSQNAGIVLSFTTTQSFIPLNTYNSVAQAQNSTMEITKTQKRQSYNFYLKGHYDIGESLRLELNYGYLPQYNEYFIANTKDSSFDMLSGGHQLGLKSFWDNALGELKTQFSFNYMDNSRTNSAVNMKGWRLSADKNWSPALGSASEGGYGNVDSKQITFNLKSSQEFSRIELGFWENRFNAGVELGYVNAFYERYQDTIFSGSAFTRPLAAGQVCDSSQTWGEWCSNSPVYTDSMTGGTLTQWQNNNGQYMYRATIYKAGKIDISNFSLGAFIEDSMRFDLGLNGGEINSRLGLRLDYDTYMNKATLAPRLAISYEAPWNVRDVTKNFATQFTFGYNRYYGRNLFAFGLMDGRSALERTITNRAYNQNWEDAAYTQNKNDTNFKQIKVPYSDELMAGFVQRVYMFDISAKYIHRFGRDEIRRMCQAPDGSFSTLNCTSNVNLPTINTSILRFVYANEGISETDVVTLSIQNNRVIDTFGIKHQYLFAFDWTNVIRNYQDYAENMTLDSVNNEIISWNGQFIRYADRPATNFVRPYTIRLNTTHTYRIYNTNIIWNNFFRFRSGYTAMASVSGANRDTYNGVPVSTFRPLDVKGAFTWDMRIGFEVDVWNKNILYVNLDIYNVLDSQNLSIAQVTSVNGGSVSISSLPFYEIGRQFWLQVGYKF
ncbi:TonB-dependent receptor plug domain-containing protein [Helicobacter saguini]|uniref:TonB-dependent receptor plug domain-containing protein n=1 Tax=Helicobacter saguini TaxID=1548018 RepID=UPI001F44B26C|nr:TonB-dependent receptor plug domain-containing protein [Helicobacter saguini]